MRRNIRDAERAALVISVFAGIIFWIGYGLIKGILFALAVFLIVQIGVLIDFFRGR